MSCKYYSWSMSIGCDSRRTDHIRVTITIRYCHNDAHLSLSCTLTLDHAILPICRDLIMACMIGNDLKWLG
jgi:hypothetical protein